MVLGGFRLFHVLVTTVKLTVLLLQIQLLSMLA